MNQPSYERYVGDVVKGGIVIVDETVPLNVQAPEGVKVVRMPAIDLAIKLGVPKAANTMMLAALMKLGATGLKRENLIDALCASFKKKPELAEKNKALVGEAEAWMEKNLGI
jgi:Pyruvate/2-oxoacid:ferredoxin oxidoreductase gamma subunit